MTPAEPKRAELTRTVAEALELPVEDRAAALAASWPDPEQRAAAERLLRACERAGVSPIFDSPASEFAAPVMAAVREDERAVPEPLRVALAGRYTIERELGRGGQATVYLARDERHGRLVAVKVLHPSMVPDDGPSRGAARFQREIAFAARLSHPHILPLYDSGAAAGRLYYITPYVDGESLRDRLARAGRPPLHETLRVLRDVARALAHAHRQGLAHLDIKPANILLNQDGDALVSDFGVARALATAATSPGAPPTELTDGTAVLGTPAYMAPEQAAGGRAIDHRADLYSFGVVAYEMLTGAAPFAGRGRHELLAAHLSEAPAPVATRSPGTPATLATLVDRLLAKRPADRPSDAAEVLRVLDAAMTVPMAPAPGGALAPVTTDGAETPRPRRRPWTRSARRALLWTATIALAAAGGATAWLLRPEGTAASRRPAPRIVAVLPFDDSGGRGDSDYVAVALADEIATQLSRLSGVAVPSERSTLAYRGSRKAAADVARELGANAIVRGGVRRAGGEVRLGIELFDARRGRRVWTREYRGPASTVIALRASVTEAIAAALDIDVTRGERAALRHVPTSSGRAYDLYLRGRADQIAAAAGGQAGPRVDALLRAESFYARARESDPEFAEPRARLALAHLALAPYDPTSARRDQARIEAEAALRLEPGMPEAHEALAEYWVLRGDLQQATSELERAVAGRPNDARLHVLMGEKLRALGRWEESVSAFERASRLDPRNSDAHFQAAVTYGRLRRYEEAIAHWDRLIAMDPAGSPMPRLIRGQAYLRLGDVDSMDAAMRRVPLASDVRGMTTYSHYTAHRIRRRNAEALATLDSSRFAISFDGVVYRPVQLMRAQTLDQMGDRTGARSSYEAARALLEDSVAAHPRDPSVRVALGLAYAGLHRRADAEREARTATELAPVSEGVAEATAAMGGAVEIFAQLGDVDAALRLIEVLLAMPAGREISIPLLRLDPSFDPLRGDPRFDALIARFSRN